MLLIHSVHNQRNVCRSESIFTFVRALRKSGSVQQANTTVRASPTSGMPLQNVLLVAMDTPLKSYVFLVPPKNKYRVFLKKAAEWLAVLNLHSEARAGCLPAEVK